MDTPSSATEPAVRRQITHEELMALPIIRYGGPIHVVKICRGFGRRACARPARRTRRRVGYRDHVQLFDKGQSYPPSLVQVATPDAVYLFQLAQLDCSHALAEMLGNKHLIKAGIALDRDLIELKKLFPFEAANILDLGDVAKHYGYGQTGVRNLAGLLLHGRITKGAQTSNWSQPNLSHPQLVYAATDAWICRELYQRFDELGLLKVPLPPKPAPKAKRAPIA